MKKPFSLLILLLFLTVGCTTKSRKTDVAQAETDTVVAVADTVPAPQPEPVKKAKKAKVEKEKPQPAEEKPRTEKTKKAQEEKVPAASAIVSGELNGHTWVDLGLSVKWATCNVGAELPQDYGDFFAWGERKPKDIYTKVNSKTDGSDVSDIVNHRRRDVARAEWGEGWRLPSKAEVQELVENCDTEWTVLEGVSGRLVKSRLNGASIFLPAAGYCGSEHYELGESGRYWTGTSETGGADAEFLFFYSEHFNWHRDHRYYGFTVRPVTE